MIQLDTRSSFLLIVVGLLVWNVLNGVEGFTPAAVHATARVSSATAGAAASLGKRNTLSMVSVFDVERHAIAPSLEKQLTTSTSSSSQEQQVVHRWGFKSVAGEKGVLQAEVASDAVDGALASSSAIRDPTLAILRFHNAIDEACASAIASLLSIRVPSIKIIVGFTAPDNKINAGSVGNSYVNKGGPIVSATVAQIEGLDCRAVLLEQGKLPSFDSAVYWHRTFGEPLPASFSFYDPMLSLPSTSSFLLFPTESFVMDSLLDFTTGLDMAYPRNAKLGETVQSPDGGKSPPVSFVATRNSSGRMVPFVLPREKGTMMALSLQAKDATTDLDKLWPWWHKQLMNVVKWATVFGH